MATKKITTLAHIKTVSNSVKNFVNSLVGHVVKTTADAIEEVEGKINKVQDVGTRITYTISMENGLLYLDDGKD